MNWPRLKVVRRSSPTESARSLPGWFMNYFNTGGVQYPLMPSQTLGHKQEIPDASFVGYSEGIFKQNGVVFACMARRAALFSEARFQFRRVRSGRPGDLYGTPALKVLEVPWVNGTTGDLLARMMQDGDLTGNFYAERRGSTLVRLRPDWMTIVMASKQEPEFPRGMRDVELLGYLYKPGGPMSPVPPEVLFPEQVVHWVPPGQTDPTATYRGMSWLTPVLREIMGDAAATTHKLQFFEQGATPNISVALGDVSPEQFERYVELFKNRNPGLDDLALFTAGGADVTVIGANMEQAKVVETQGHIETRICMAAGVPPIIAGSSESLGATAYTAYQHARRAFADLTMSPLWRTACAALQTVITVPGGSELWYDDSDIRFLQEDRTDEADIQEKQSRTLKGLVEAGYTPDSAKDAVVSGDFGRLEHSGLTSVQLLPPASKNGTSNGKSNGTPAQLQLPGGGEG